MLTSTPLLAVIANGDFNISNPYHPNFGWTTRGATTILNGQAVLSEDSPFFSNLITQTFIVPEGAKTLQFTLVDAQLGSTNLSHPNSNPCPKWNRKLIIVVRASYK
ncbi:MAG: hypothetical protein AAGF26_09365 [Cyanobacteria bacterium P01_G01_bin.49]